MAWFGFWIFLSVYVVIESWLYSKGHNTLLFEHRTPFEKELRRKATFGDRSNCRRVVAAAIRADDGEVLISIRHYSADAWKQIDARPDGSKFHHLSGDQQGFVDQYGVYMNRTEALQVAQAAEQVVNPSANQNGELFSEALY